MSQHNDIVPSRFPDRPLDAANEKWWVAKVKPRQEKLLAEDFLHYHIEYYLPLYVRNTPRKGSKSPRLFHIPLFPGYIAFSQDKPNNIFSSGRVVNLIEIKNQKRFIRQLNQIYFLLQGNAPVEPAGETYDEGTEVEIIKGPFVGTRGILSKNTAAGIILNVDCLGVATLKIDIAWVKQVGELEE